MVAPSSPRAFIKTGTTSMVEITTTVTGEPAIQLTLTAEQTKELPVGELAYDVFAVCSNNDKQVSKGLVNVVAIDRVTPEEDSKAMELRYYQNTDFRRTFTWKDSDSNLQTVSDAYMQAKDSAGATVLDIRWYATAPDEATIAAITDGTQRGYLTTSTDVTATIDLHISDLNTVVSGSHSFDLFVKDSVGDWDLLAKGTLVVESSVSSPPT